MEKEKRIFGAYTRKSKFTGKGESIGMQKDEIIRYTEYHYSGFDCRIIYYNEGEGVSAAAVKRDAYERLMEDLKNGKLDGVLVYKLDRFSRSIAEFSNDLKIINRAKAPNASKVAFISVTDNLSNDNRWGDMMLNLVAIFSEFERNVIKERTQDGILKMAKEGKVLGGTIPVGFIGERQGYLSENGKLKTCKVLMPCPEEQKIVLLIYEKYLKLQSLAGLESYLMQNDIKTSRDCWFGCYSLRFILTNPVYCVADKDAYEFLTEQGYGIYSEEAEFDGTHGLIGYNKTAQMQEQENRDLREQGIEPRNEVKRSKEVAEWVIAVSSHKGMIAGAIWAKTQLMLGENKIKSYRKARKTKALLSGLIRCEGCNGCMRPKALKRKLEDGSTAFCYVCELKEKSRSCKCEIVNAPMEVDGCVIHKIFQTAAEIGILYEKPAYYSFQETENSDDIETQSKCLVKTIKKRESERINYLNAIGKAENEAVIEDLLIQIEETQRQIGILKLKLEKLSLPNENQTNGELERLRKVFETFTSNTFYELTYENQRKYLKMLVESVFWDGMQINIIFHDSLADDISLYCQ